MKNKVIAFITSKTTFKQTQKEKKNTLTLVDSNVCKTKNSLNYTN